MGRGNGKAATDRTGHELRSISQGPWKHRFGQGSSAKAQLAQSHRPKVDRGADASIPASEFDTFALLLQSLAAYTDLVKRDVGPEGVVLSLFDHALNDDVQRLPEGLQPMGVRLMQVPPEERRAFCALLIDELDATLR